MDERLEKALEFSKFVETQNNQKTIFLNQFKENLIHYTHGHKFTATQQLITFVSVIVESGEDTAIILDDNNLPVLIEDLKGFMRELVGVYVFA